MIEQDFEKFARSISERNQQGRADLQRQAARLSSILASNDNEGLEAFNDELPIHGPQLPLCHRNRCHELIQPIKFRYRFDPNASERFDRCFHCKRYWSDIDADRGN